MNLGEHREINDKWEISGESCLKGQVTAFGLGIGFFLHKKQGLARHDVVMAKPFAWLEIIKKGKYYEKNKYDFDIVICGLFDGFFSEGVGR